MVMKDEELSTSVKEVTNNTRANNAMNTTNSTNSTRYPPLSTNPEMVMNEEQSKRYCPMFFNHAQRS